MFILVILFSVIERRRTKIAISSGANHRSKIKIPQDGGQVIPLSATKVGLQVLSLVWSVMGGIHLILNPASFDQRELSIPNLAPSLDRDKAIVGCVIHVYVYITYTRQNMSA